MSTLGCWYSVCTKPYFLEASSGHRKWPTPSACGFGGALLHVGVRDQQETTHLDGSRILRHASKADPNNLVTNAQHAPTDVDMIWFCFQAICCNLLREAV